MAEAIKNFWNSVSTKWYEKQMQGKSEQEKDEFRASKVKWYGKVCVSGIGALFLGNTLSALKKLKETHPDPRVTYPCVAFFLLCFLFMGLGAAAAYSPTNTPGHPVGLTGNGAWVAVVCALGCFHLATYELHASPQATYALASMAITSIAVTMYWALKAQDPSFLHVFVKLLGWAVYGIWKLLALGCAGVIDAVARMLASCRGYHQL